MEFCFTTIASGSSGNCIYVGSEKNNLLIDAGISGKKVEQGLATIGVDPSNLNGIFITHEHHDHIKGVGVLARRYRLPIYATPLTWQAIEQMDTIVGDIPQECKQVVQKDKEILINDIVVQPYGIPHDAADPVAYSFYKNKKKISVATDLGHTNDYIEKNLAESNLILLEANHDIDMLEVGAYPYFLKQRILGSSGHLCNEVAGQILSRLYHPNLEVAILGHLSRENNFPALAYQTVYNELVADDIGLLSSFQLKVAEREGVTDIYQI